MNLRDVMGPGAVDRGEDEAERVRRQGRPCYVRFGEAPKDGLSRDPFDNTEPGLSVFHGYEMPDGSVFVDPGEGWHLRGTLVVLIARGYPPFIARGRWVGTGGAGEPCLADFTLEPVPLGRVSTLYPPTREEMLAASMGTTSALQRRKWGLL